MKTVVIICRGHSGSRAIAEFFIKNGFFFGEKLNASLDKEPYHLVRQSGEYVIKKCLGYHNHKPKLKSNDKKHLISVKKRFNNYLKDIHAHEGNRGWKMTETLFSYPFLRKIYPNYYYLFWTRSISRRNEHARGDYSDKMLTQLRVIKGAYDESWNFQNQLVLNTPRPKHFIHIRFEDFVMNQDKQVKRLERWLKTKLPARIDVMKDKVYNDDHYNLNAEYLAQTMKQLGYISDLSKVVIHKQKYGPAARGGKAGRGPNGAAEHYRQMRAKIQTQEAKKRRRPKRPRNHPKLKSDEMVLKDRK